MVIHNLNSDGLDLYDCVDNFQYIICLSFLFFFFFIKPQVHIMNKFQCTATDVIKSETHFYSMSIHKLCISIQIGDSFFS